MRKQEIPESLAFRAARVPQPVQRDVERGKNGGVQRGTGSLVFCSLGRIEHAAKGEQAIGSGRCGAVLLLQSLRKSCQITQEFLVDDRLSLKAEPREGKA